MGLLIKSVTAGVVFCLSGFDHRSPESGNIYRIGIELSLKAQSIIRSVYSAVLIVFTLKVISRIDLNTRKISPYFHSS